MKPENVPKRCTWNKEKEEWRCNKCGSLILQRVQTVSLTMPPSSVMAGWGFGETATKIIPYCPKCESEPSNTGHSYYGSDDDPDVQDLKIIKKIGERLQ